MAYEPWKELERRTAKLLGGTRLWRPDFSDSIPDGESETHTWDCKAYASIAVIAWYVKALAKYRAFNGDRNFVLVLFSRKHRGAGDFVLVPGKRYRELLQKAGEL